jgi:hypothetical protein
MVAKKSGPTDINAGFRILRLAGHIDIYAPAGIDHRRIRKTGLPHARDLAEPLAQIAVEGRHLGALMASLESIHLEQQQVLAIETQVYRFQVG